MSDAVEFVTYYTPALDRKRIAFAWNGKHADAFADANFTFRHQVLRLVVKNLSAAPIELVRDLYEAETAWAREAWGVHLKVVSALAEELLTRGGPVFVEDFLMGKYGCGMDAYGAASFDCPRELAERLLAEVNQRLAAGAEGTRKTLLEAGRDTFLWWRDNATH